MYLSRISRPFLDRIDLCVEAPRVEYRHLADERKGESSAAIRKRVCRAREIQKKRYEGDKNDYKFDASGKGYPGILRAGGKGTGSDGAGIYGNGTDCTRISRVIKTARTIADLEGEAKIRNGI